MRDLNTLASTVLEEKSLKTRWVAEVEIDLMSKFFSVPRLLKGLSVQKKENELCKQSAELIATKILELEKLIESEIPPDALFVLLRD